MYSVWNHPVVGLGHAKLKVSDQLCMAKADL